MAVTYSTAAKNSRLDAVTTLLGATSKLIIMDASSSTLATIALANPAAPGASAGVLTFTMPRSDSSADASGTAAKASMLDSSSAGVITGLTVGTSSTDIVLDSVSITASQTITISTATITHA